MDETSGPLREVISACLPLHPVVAYLFLVNPDMKQRPLWRCKKCVSEIALMLVRLDHVALIVNTNHGVV